jgi:hypothetical protein
MLLSNTVYTVHIPGDLSGPQMPFVHCKPIVRFGTSESREPVAIGRDARIKVFQSEQFFAM